MVAVVASLMVVVMVTVGEVVGGVLSVALG